MGECMQILYAPLLGGVVCRPRVGRFGGLECQGAAGCGLRAYQKVLKHQTYRHCCPLDFHTLWNNGTSYSRNPLGQTDLLTEPWRPRPAAPRHSSPLKAPHRGPTQPACTPLWSNIQPAKIIYTTESTTQRVTWGRPPPHPSLDSPMGSPAHNKAHTATHTSHPQCTCRTQNYIYTVKYLKAKDQFNMNILYSNKISLPFQTMY